MTASTMASRSSGSQPSKSHHVQSALDRKVEPKRDVAATRGVLERAPPVLAEVEVAARADVLVRVHRQAAGEARLVHPHEALGEPRPDGRLERFPDGTVVLDDRAGPAVRAVIAHTRQRPETRV